MDFKDPKNQILILIIIAFLALVYVWYEKFYTPYSQDLAVKKTRLEQILTRLHAVEQKAATLETLQSDYDALLKRFNSVRMYLPETKRDEEFISQLHIAAQLSNTAVLSITPQAAVTGEYFIGNPYLIELSATYDGLGEFLARVANLPFIVAISDLQITAIDQSQGTTQSKSMRRKDHVLTANFKLISYNARETVAIAGGEPK